MSGLTVGLIPANRLLDVLRDVLKQSNELTIKHIEFLPPAKLKLSDLSDSAEPEASGVFKHTVELSMQGNYFDLLHYLQGLEDLPWTIYWDSLNYQVSGYPLADIELKVSTMSLSEVLFEKQMH